MKSVVSGVAGSVRLVQLTRAGLTVAEKHGKRLDAAGKARAINNTPALTRTGLDLNALYEAHVKDVFIPEAKTKAMHMIFQFPKELVDPDDAAGMLHHARAYAERVFGPDAVFADRIDRDEKNTQVVDLFIAPKYVKRTKKSEKVAVSMTRDLKRLAEKHGHPPVPQGIGRAMQDELFEYFRDIMKLDGVERGAKKAYPGPDWKSAEQQRLEELEGIGRGLDERAAAQDARTADLDAREAMLNERYQELADRETKISARETQLDADETAVRKDRGSIARDHSQAMLLLRAAYDDEGLELTLHESGKPKMNEGAMSDGERLAYRLVWSERMLELARFVANALQAMRAKIAEITKRERAAKEREKAVAMREEAVAAKEGDLSKRAITLLNNEDLFDKKADLLQRILDQAMQFRRAWDPIPERERSPAINRAMKAAQGLTPEDLPPGFLPPGRGGISGGIGG